MIIYLNMKCSVCGTYHGEKVYASYDEYKATPGECIKCGGILERSWTGRGGAALWGNTSCPTASGGKGTK